MPEPAVAEPQAPKTETYADFKTGFDKPASAAADVQPNAHGVNDPQGSDPSAPAGDPAAAQPGDGSDPSLKQDKVEKRKQQIQRDIDQQVARREAAKREADAEEERLRKLKGGSPSPKESAPEGAAPKPFDGTDPSDPEPTQDQFTDYQQWLDARAGWIGRKEFRKLEHRKTQKAAEEAQARSREEAQRGYKAAVTDFETRSSEYAAEHDDYPDLVAKFKETKISPETQAFLLWGCQGEEGPAMLHRLMKEPDKLKEIDGQKTPILRFDALYKFKYESRIAELEAELAQARQTPAAPKKSSAPPAGTNLRGGGNPPVIDESAGYTAWKKKSFDPKHAA